MEIRNSVNHKAVGFGNSVVIKQAKEATLLNMIELEDSSQWKSLSNPEFRYEHLALCEDKDGFYSGLLVDNVEKDAVHGVDKLIDANLDRNTHTLNEDIHVFNKLCKNIASLSKTIEIKTAEQVKELLKLKSVDEIIKRFAK